MGDTIEDMDIEIKQKVNKIEFLEKNWGYQILMLLKR